MNPLAAAAAIAIGSWVAVPSGAWVPSSVEVAEVRANIEPFVRRQALEQHVQLHGWPEYTFQYQGQLEHGRKVIFINAFCIAPPEYTQKRLVIVFDGGPCFFQAKYDVQQKHFLQVAFNGEA